MRVEGAESHCSIERILHYKYSKLSVTTSPQLVHPAIKTDLQRLKIMTTFSRLNRKRSSMLNVHAAFSVDTVCVWDYMYTCMYLLCLRLHSTCRTYTLQRNNKKWSMYDVKRPF